MKNKILTPFCAFLVLVTCLSGCSSIQEPGVIRVVVRKEPGKIIDGNARYTLKDRSSGGVIASDMTNDMGIAVISRPPNKRFGDIDITVTYDGITSSVALNPYNDFYEVYLQRGVTPVPEDQRVADFHYHLSMKPHNTYAQFYYVGNSRDEIPTNLAWMRISKKLRVYHNGSWKKPALKPSVDSEDDREITRTYLENRWVRSKDGANNFRTFTQATSPHSLDGNVYLAFNAISPFEHSVSNDGVKRFVSSKIKSGADMKWLFLMGDKKNYLTHWENFNNELKMIGRQQAGYNNFDWQILLTKSGSIASLDKPTVINVVEGGHILQDKYFPHAINFDLMDSTSKENQALYRAIRRRARSFAKNAKDTVTIKRIDSLEQALRRNEELLKQTRAGNVKSTAHYNAQKWNLRNRFIHDLLMDELISNIDSLKKLDIHMVSISHLSYNGMVGHALALDVSQKPFFFEKIVSIVAQRAYGIRVSNDKRYRKAYDGLFYRVPGINAFGDTLITHLLDASRRRRIQIDFKHADVFSRQFLFRKYDELKNVRPICSHCAVNGLPIGFSSPLVNEYRMLHSSLSRKFYPFAINLYNEEIKEFCERDGIIGIPLEERVLGGYMNNKIGWPITIRHRKGRYYTIDRPSLNKRIRFTEDALKLLDQDKTKVFEEVKAYYRNTLPNGQTISESGLLDFICEEYFSAEPFLQNLFHIVDIAHTVKRESGERVFVLQTIARVAGPQQDNDSVASAAAQSAKQLSDAEISIDKSSTWSNVCIGSDLDGLIDPINICPTASQYPFFKEKLLVLIPLFLHVRRNFEIRDKILGPYRGEENYFDNSFTIKRALDLLFYKNLKQFTEKTFLP